MLHSPEHARQERRRALQAGLTGVVMGLVTLGLGINGIRTGEWVDFGRQYSSLMLPGWIVAATGVSILWGSGWILWKFARKT